MRRNDMREQKTASEEAGFTLIETMISIVVLVVGLIGVVNLFIVASTSNFTANQTTAAAALASEQLETLKAIPFTTLVVGGSLTNDLSPAATCPGNAANFSCSENVPAAGYGRVRLRWTVTDRGPGKVGIEVEALPQTGLATGRARVRLATIRTCTGTGCPAIP
jgi:type II secretory pathway pseudopilin PulG